MPNIYKNLTRDIRMYYVKAFSRFLKENNLTMKEKMMSEAFYPYLIRAFV